MFSKATEYALRATIYIAQRSIEEKKPGLAEIAGAIDSPRSFTAKILQSLTKNNKLICSIRGPGGGFFMTEKARNLPVRSILEAMNEDEILEKCVLGLKRCSETKPCPMHFQYKTIKEQFIQLFEKKTIQHLAVEMAGGASLINNKILISKVTGQSKKP
jgi:Rrf2 family protein